MSRKTTENRQRRILATFLLLLCFHSYNFQVHSTAIELCDTGYKEGARQERWELLETYPHNRRSFTQGLSWYEGKLFESVGYEISIRELCIESGEFNRIKRVEPEENPNVFGEGLTILNGTIRVFTWRSGTGYLLDENTLELLDTFKIRTTTGQGWGLTTDGKQLIASDGSHYLHFLDPVSHEMLYKLPVENPLDGRPLHHLNELQWGTFIPLRFARGLIFANVWFSEVIYAIDPKTGKVQAYYDMAELYPKAKRTKTEKTYSDAVLNGIAYRPDEDTFYLTVVDGWKKSLVFSTLIR